MNKFIVVYPTSANPPTLGHADILSRLANRFDLVYWLIADNPRKNPFFSIEDRLAMMNLYIQHLELKNIVIDYYKGAVVRYAKSKGASFLLRGLRNATDFQSEIELASANRNLDSTIETISLFANPRLSAISSRLVRELAYLGEDFSEYVIESVAKIIKQAFVNNQGSFEG